MPVIKKSLATQGKEYVGKHFSAYEFASVSPSPYYPSRTYSDEILICTELVDKLELITYLTGATSVYVSSGYRTKVHDKAVGGNGYGQHTTGRAADVRFHKGSQIIDNRIISVIAQDIGLKGIARIDQFGFIHLDMRLWGTYYGDETRGTYSVTDNFRKYYGISNKDISAAIGRNYAFAEGRDFTPIFDAEYYSNKYSDLRAAFGTDQEALLKHFVDYGMKEGRQANNAFNPTVYKNKYEDLRKAFGNNMQSYYEHYMDYGYKEGRNCH